MKHVDLRKSSLCVLLILSDLTGNVGYKLIMIDVFVSVGVQSEIAFRRTSNKQSFEDADFVLLPQERVKETEFVPVR